MGSVQESRSKVELGKISPYCVSNLSITGATLGQTEISMQDTVQTAAGPAQKVNGHSPSKRKLGRPTLSNEELLDIALELFLDNGFEKTSVEAIAASAGMAKRTIYARFEDKETLFRAALSRAIDRWIVPVDRLRELETDDLEETLLRIAEVLLTNILSPTGLQLYRLTNTVSAHMPEIAIRNVHQGTEPTIAFLADLFSRCVDFTSEQVINPMQAAYSFIHLVIGGPASMAAWGKQFDLETLRRHASSSVRLLLRGLLPREEDGQATMKENSLLRQLLTDALIENAILKRGDNPQESENSGHGQDFPD